MAELIDLAARRTPVTYTITVTHHWDDRLEYFVEGVSEEDRSQEAVRHALWRFGGFEEKADALHRALLLRIDALMGAPVDSPEANELRSLADLVSEYEALRSGRPHP